MNDPMQIEFRFIPEGLSAPQSSPHMIILPHAVLADTSWRLSLENDGSSTLALVEVRNCSHDDLGATRPSGFVVTLVPYLASTLQNTDVRDQIREILGLSLGFRVTGAIDEWIARAESDSLAEVRAAPPDRYLDATHQVVMRGKPQVLEVH